MKDCFMYCSNVISAINFPVCCSDVHKFNIRKELERMMSR